MKRQVRLRTKINIPKGKIISDQEELKTVEGLLQIEHWLNHIENRKTIVFCFLKEMQEVNDIFKIVAMLSLCFKIIFQQKVGANKF